jgi:hypothetical protein
MRSGWDELLALGVPAGAVRPAPARPVDDETLRAAVDGVCAPPDPLSPAEREALAAWLASFRHHWPGRFHRALGPQGEELWARLAASGLDANRYLKLRRIATENLAKIL